MKQHMSRHSGICSRIGRIALIAACSAAALPVGAAAPPAAPAAATCANTSDPVQRLICADGQLAQQDRTVSELYASAQQQYPEAERKQLKARQSSWLTAREACVNGERPRECLADQQQRRIIELKIGLGQLPAPATVEYACAGQDSAAVTASYYPTDPPAVLLSYHNHQAVAFLAESASGARYATGEVEIWEHQGEARFRWGKTQLTCRRP
jgi:uncharacterized protein